MKKKIIIAPSILAGNFGNLAKEAERAERAGADWLHVDIMDGHFVPNITIGPKAVASIRKATKLPLDVHLMLSRPQDYIASFAAAGADIITVHVEAKHNIRKTLMDIKKLRCGCGLVLNPDTPARRVKSYMDIVDMILVMSVYPGFGNQKFISRVLPNVMEIDGYIKNVKKKINLQIDGGINPDTAKLAVRAGVNVLVAGTAVFGRKDIRKAIKDLRKA